jgi:hypothetical protein
MDQISTSVVLPVTDAQMMAFCAWIVRTYVSYDRFMDALKSPDVDTYIKTHILPLEMLDVLHMSHPYIGEKRGDNNIRRLLLYRRRVIAKMTNLKGKIVRMTFPVEAARTRIENLAAALNRRQEREAYRLRYEQERQAYLDYTNATYASRVREVHERREAMSAKVYPYPPTVKIQLSEDDAKTLVMDDDCVICLAQHKMTDACTINCGHQFGRLCLAKWKKDTCPLCRTQITETTVFIDTYLKNAAIEQEILASVAA